MVKVTGPLFSHSAGGWLGKYTYARTGLVANPYPIALINPYLNTGMYYSRIGWCYQRKRTWHGIIYSAMKPPISAQPKTPAQEANKAKFALAVLSWQGMNQTTKDYYHKLRYPVHASGYNRFIHYYMLDKPC